MSAHRAWTSSPSNSYNPAAALLHSSARGGRSGRTPAGCRPAKPTSPSAHRWWRTAVRSARRIRCCAAASAAVRACNSRYVSALPMAITACSAKVLQQRDLAVGETARLRRVQRRWRRSARRRAATAAQWWTWRRMSRTVWKMLGLRAACRGCGRSRRRECPAGNAIHATGAMGNMASIPRYGSGVDAERRTLCASTQPSNSNSPTDMPLHSSCARRTIRSNTG